MYATERFNAEEYGEDEEGNEYCEEKQVIRPRLGQL